MCSRHSCYLGDYWLHHRHSDWLHHRSMVESWPALAHNCIEAMHRICGVVHRADAAIWLHQAVLPLDYVSFSFLRLLLDVASVLVIHSVVKRVTRWRLRERILSLSSG